MYNEKIKKIKMKRKRRPKEKINRRIIKHQKKENKQN